MGKWYVGFYDCDGENAYEKFNNDEEAIMGLSYSDEGYHCLEVWECADDETLTPIRHVA